MNLAGSARPVVVPFLSFTLSWPFSTLYSVLSVCEPVASGATRSST